MSTPTINNGQVAICSTNSSTASDWTVISPKSLKPIYTSLASDSSGRSLGGVIVIEYIKEKLVKLEIELPPTDDLSIISTISNIVQGKMYYIKFKDISTNTFVVKHVYTSDSSADWYNGIVSNGILQGFSFNAIEVGD